MSTTGAVPAAGAAGAAGAAAAGAAGANLNTPGTPPTTKKQTALLEKIGAKLDATRKLETNALGLGVKLSSENHKTLLNKLQEELNPLNVDIQNSDYLDNIDKNLKEIRDHIIQSFKEQIKNIDISKEDKISNLMDIFKGLDDLPAKEKLSLLNQKDKAGNTPLHLAAKQETATAVTALLENLTPEQKFELFEQKDTEGNTPFDAASNGDVIETLLMHGAEPLNQHKSNKALCTKAREKLAIINQESHIKTYVLFKVALLEHQDVQSNLKTLEGLVATLKKHTSVTSSNPQQLQPKTIKANHPPPPPSSTTTTDTPSTDNTETVKNVKRNIQIYLKKMQTDVSSLPMEVEEKKQIQDTIKALIEPPNKSQDDNKTILDLTEFIKTVKTAIEKKINTAKTDARESYIKSFSSDKKTSIKNIEDPNTLFQFIHTFMPPHDPILDMISRAGEPHKTEFCKNLSAYINQKSTAEIELSSLRTSGSNAVTVLNSLITNWKATINDPTKAHPPSHNIKQIIDNNFRVAQTDLSTLINGMIRTPFVRSNKITKDQMLEMSKKLKDLTMNSMALIDQTKSWEKDATLTKYRSQLLELQQAINKLNEKLETSAGEQEILARVNCKTPFLTSSSFDSLGLNETQKNKLIAKLQQNLSGTRFYTGSSTKHILIPLYDNSGHIFGYKSTYNPTLNVMKRRFTKTRWTQTAFWVVRNRLSAGKIKSFLQKECSVSDDDLKDKMDSLKKILTADKNGRMRLKSIRISISPKTWPIMTQETLASTLNIPKFLTGVKNAFASKTVKHTPPDPQSLTFDTLLSANHPLKTILNKQNFNTYLGWLKEKPDPPSQLSPLHKDKDKNTITYDYSDNVSYTINFTTSTTSNLNITRNPIIEGSSLATNTKPELTSLLNELYKLSGEQSIHIEDSNFPSDLLLIFTKAFTKPELADSDENIGSADIAFKNAYAKECIEGIDTILITADGRNHLEGLLCHLSILVKADNEDADNEDADTLKDNIAILQKKLLKSKDADS
jgi:hypothetical protein